MYTYPNTSATQVITKKVTRTTKSYTEDGKLFEEVTEEEITYGPAPSVPTTPWILTNTANSHYDHTHFEPRIGDDVAPPLRRLIN